MPALPGRVRKALAAVRSLTAVCALVASALAAAISWIAPWRPVELRLGLGLDVGLGFGHSVGDVFG